MKIKIDKPVIPQFVADWIENLPAYYNVRGVLDIVGEDNAKDILDWCSDVDNYLTYKTLVTAYLYGYEVEQAPLYYAKVKGWENKYLDEPFYWNHITYEGGENKLGIADYVHEGSDIYAKTIQNWNELGINDTNSDFEEVE